MKKIFVALFLMGCLICSSNETQAQFFLKIRPTIVVNPRTVSPSNRHIWIQPEYVWRNGNYVLINGYWYEPRVGYKYIPGHWMQKRRRGHYWVPGRWVR